MKSFNDSLTGKYLRIALPAALEGIFMTFLAAADLIMVGVLGAKAIAAVSIFLPLRLVLLTVSRSLASAVTILTANKFGSGQYSTIKVLLRQSFTVSSILLVVLHLLFYGFFEKLVVLMGAQRDYLELALGHDAVYLHAGGSEDAYGNIAVAAVLLNSLSLLLQGTLLGVGLTSAIMKSDIVGNVVNIVCNYFLITGFGSFAGWGVRGAAISTIIGSLCTLGITVWIMKHEGFFSDGLLQLPDKVFWRKFMPVFGGVFSELGAERIGMLAYGWMTARLGTLPYAVHSICYNICDFSYDFIFGFGKANMVLAGQMRGAADYATWKRCRSIGFKWGLGLSVASFIILYAARVPIFSVYSQDAQALALSETVMFWVAAVCIPQGHTIITAGILRGSGQTTAVAVYSFVLITVLRPLMTAFFIYYCKLGIVGAWVPMFLDQSLRSLCFTWKVMRIRGLKDLIK